MYEFSETDEIASRCYANPRTWEEARALALRLMPDEGEQLRDNLAWSLIRATAREAFTEARAKRRQV